MKQIMYQVDAFTSEVFGGNPAAVCLMDSWPGEELMQQIAMENNLSETAFVVKEGSIYKIRWFTPGVEVDLCGHATLASAFVIFKHVEPEARELAFHSPRSGPLGVRKKEDGWLELDFPADILKPVDLDKHVIEALGAEASAAFKGKTDLMLVYETQGAIENMVPDFHKLRKLPVRGVIVTAPGDAVDFVSRFFAPQSGVDEDPVTGSAHTTLVPYWAERLGKKMLHARQISGRGGELICEPNGDRVKIAGQAVQYMKGTIEF